jgi:hypothetical protein
MTGTSSSILAPGAQWLRWDPHIHAPGTRFNDQFKGDWEGYLTALETADPPIRAIGVTDYYGFETYEKVRAYKAEGRLAGCELLFPNVELRFSIGTARSWINVHLLISPADPDHVANAARFLERLTFKTSTRTYCCRPSDLIQLGRAFDASKTDDKAALEFGSEQFKVTFDQLRDEYNDDAWAKENIVIAVAGAKGDGTSGLQDGADQVLRQQLEHFAHAIFASAPAQREYWLGRKSSREKIVQTYGGLKPCLHGCDAHDISKTGAPDGDRFSWLKGAPIFDTLWQACIDPEGRAFVGYEPPPAAALSETITKVEINGAPWAATPAIELNAGLVAIIGSRGSGKTALADIIAAGCDAHGETLPDQAFLVRANEHLGGATVRLNWGGGGTEDRALDNRGALPWDSYERARYLSQQFVDDLCSADGMTDGLLSEVERVVFDAHSPGETDGAVDFSDLRDMRAARFRQAREREEETLEILSDRINQELEKKEQLPSLKKQVSDKEGRIRDLTADRNRLATKGSENRIKRLAELSEAANTKRSQVRALNNREQKLLLVQDDVASFRSDQAPEAWRETQERHRDSGIAGTDWDPFLQQFTGDVDSVLNRHLSSARNTRDQLRGSVPPAGDPNVELIAATADLASAPLALLEAEIKRLGDLVSVDKETKDRFNALSAKITSETELLAGLRDKVKDCEEADSRLANLPEQREATYIKIFEAVLDEESVLNALYAPIRAIMDEAGGTLGKLAFRVRRRADVERWAKDGEALLDLRRTGPFKGEGKLLEHATRDLKPAWEKGKAADVAAAIKTFREAYQRDLFAHAPVARADNVAFRAWLKRFARWLYATEHIEVRYSVEYDGIDIRKLSPGTRGIVLLLLYLALDTSDERPLIIDQPEENLDPKSIYDELVGLFLKAKSKRQVIMVTHNANLVVNTDADQVIVAEAGPHPADGLPSIRYTSGGLEEAHIRKMVCDILEGGEHAFQERARRLRVKLPR